MLNISIGEIWMIGLLVLSPFVLRNAGKARSIILFLLSAAVFVLSITSIWQAGAMLIFMLIPFFYVRINKGKLPRFPLVIFLIIAFIYFNQYTWIFTFTPIPMLPFKLLGLSYILFRVIDYTLQFNDLKSRNKQGAFLEYFNYLFFYYTITAGPISRFEQFTETVSEKPEDLTYNQIFKSLWRASYGFIKVYLLSVFCSDISAKAYLHISLDQNPAAWFVMLAIFNALFIYFNFSGYCDVVISFASLAGFDVSENFNKPYLARNMVEFWNRWHITLSQWIRDYLFSPFYKFLLSRVLKNKVKTAQYIALFFTFLMAGIWHGTSYNYIVYGVLQGLGVVLSTVYKNVLISRLGKKGYKVYSEKTVVKVAERVVCLSYVCFSFAFVGQNLIELFLK